MKKLLYLLLPVVSLASGCTTDLTNEETVNTPPKQMMEITVSIETDEPAQDESRTSLYDNGVGKIEWSPNDTVGAISEDGTLTQCRITGISEDGKATLSVPTDIKYAVYPYTADTKLADEGLQVSLPQTVAFDGTNRVFGDGQNFMTAVFAYNSLSFKNLCGYIEVRLKGAQTVTGIALRDNVLDWNALSGIATVNIDDADRTPALTMGTNHGTTFNWIYGKCENGVRLNADTPTSFYFIVPPGTYNNLNLCIQTSEGSYSFTSSRTVTVNRSKIRPLSAIDLSSSVASGATRLDIDGTANCYVVPQSDNAAGYSFSAKKINGSAAIENIAYAQLVWSTDADMIGKLHYDTAKGIVEFEYAGGGKEGNALVAVADAENTILWCWHIWCTDKPECIAVKGGDNTTLYAVLDRNLGATYTPKSIADISSLSDEDATAACGLYYQYGRPTPFPSLKSIRTAGTETAFKTNTDVALQYGFKAYGQDFRLAHTANDFNRALQYPNLFFTCYVNSAGEIQSSSSGAAGNRWQKELINPYTGVEKAWFSKNAANITYKSDYDPCPAGYVVDDSSSGYHYLGKNTLTRHDWGSEKNTIYGYYLYQESTGSMLYCPVSGYRDGAGRVSGAGQYLNYWFVPTSNQGDIKTYRFYAGNSTNASITMSYAAYANQSYGFNVRCRRMNRDMSIVIENKPFDHGDGTADSPYIISSATDFIKLSDYCNGVLTNKDEKDLTAAYYELGNDIDMGGKPLNAIAPFKGHFDGKGYCITDLNVQPSGTAPVGLFGSTDGATIKNFTLRNFTVTVTNEAQLMTAAVAGRCADTTIENISVSGRIISNAKATFVSAGGSNGSSSVVGAIAAYITDSSISDCHFDGYISARNQFAGGIAAVAENTEIRDCSVKGDSEIVCNMNHAGGIVAMMRLGSSVSNCKVEASVKCNYALHGGIAGAIEDGRIENCVVGSNAEITGHVSNTNVSYIGTGGIAGMVYPKAAGGQIRINNCACYCPVSANIAVGGIVGYVRSTNATDNIFITNCLFKGTLTAVSKNSYNYDIVGGIAAYCHDTNNGQVHIANCASLVDNVSFLSTAASAGIGGVSGYVRYKASFDNCYSNLTAADIVSHDQGKPISDYSNIKQYGGIYGVTYGADNQVSYSHCYYPNSVKQGHNLGEPTIDQVEAVSGQNMTDGTLLGKLNAAVATYNASASTDAQASTWVAGADGYPVPSTAPSDPAPSTGTKKTRVSVIGDSISTFNGYIPAGYAAFYPTGTVISASQTYWYKLIYNYMSNAKLDTNIAWSGTLVTRSTDTACASEHWYGHDFVARFIDKGMGNPDVIIVHGGTNDVSGRGSVSLYPNYAIAGEAYPSDAEFSACFATADAAETREAVEALDDTCFVNAYIKLICLIHQQYPNAKVVMLIGDWLPAGARQTIHKIAAHYGGLYGYKCVDFQDIASLHDTKVIPKETGCHPNEAGFEVMARYIYQSVGSYID